MRKVQRALMSVSDKSGVVGLARALADMKVEILSTGGTARTLRQNGIEILDVSDYTGFPEMLDGRVKTLHPKIHGGLLGQRENPEHIKTMAKHGIEAIDMVVVNLYPFEATIAKPNCTLDEAIENIDIGGPTMIRSAAKNYRDVAVVVDPGDYDDLIAELRENDGQVSARTRFRLAKKVFQMTARYDGAISNYLSTVEGED
ncbi:MAG: IMP cyclohydrolase [Syntrophobacterales bacterium]|nr:MAG: IMP cyclohydrolase [Syntrophobacterales bacterium]